MRFSITGLNHKTAPVEVREQLAFPESVLPVELGRLRRAQGAQEALILSTCNRVEVAVAAEDSLDLQRAVTGFLAEHARREGDDWLRPHLYHYEGREAIRHLFRVASSLDSLVVGEPQILGQLKQAYAHAKAAGTCGSFLDAVLTRAFSVAKRVRSETEIGQSAVSISFAAVELAREIFGTLNDTRVMLVGAGKMSELAARHLRRNGATQIYVANRTYERAAVLARQFDGWLVDYSSFVDTLPAVDIVITSSGAPHYILSRDQLKRVVAARRNKPVFVIDIAVPRNVDPAAGELDGVFLYDIDDLQRVVERNVEGRRSAAQAAETLIEEEVERLEARLKSRAAAPTIVSLQTHLEQIRASEVERLHGRLGTLTPQQEEALEALTRGIINKIAHGPITEIRKQAGQEEGANVIETIRRMFRLGD
jgi:glutamyl-tRNA reductase